MKKTILITGASYGIGEATALAFAKAGYNIVLNYRANAGGSEKVAEKCRALGVEVLVIQADMSDEGAVTSLKEQVIERFGKLSVLVNNAAFTEEADFDEIDKAGILHAITQNILTALLAIRAFVPDHMEKGASVLNLVSIYGLPQGGRHTLPLYSASKAALINLTESFARRYARDIRFNAVAPGFTMTPAWDDVTEERKKKVVESTLLKEWVTAEEIASTLLFMVNTPHINAETIVVDAGWSKKDNP